MSSKKEVVSSHRHCNGCGAPIPLDETFCSPECANKLISQRKKQQRSTFIFMGIIFLAMLFFLFSRGFGASTPPTP
ncbi:MAG: family Zn-ribbon protein [Dehalococcoidia bacterium]|nr:family Zn-ribbon protein [Dehalococcoidia bacterium]